MNKLISIIVPVYNVKDYLKTCIDSILQQRYTNWELLLIDDGSSDGSGAICDNYRSCDSRIKVFHKANGGVSAARNCGLQNMNGSYFTCVDADDWLDNNYLSSLMEEALNTGSDVIATGYKRVYENNETDNHYIVDKCTTITNAAALDCALDPKNSWVGFACGKLYKKSVVQANCIQYDTEISICEDSLFNYMVLSHSNMVTLIPGNYYNYRIRSNSATTTAFKNLNKLYTKVVAFEKAMQLAEKYPKSLFQKRVTANVYDSIVFYILSMFRAGQYNTVEVEKCRKRLDELDSCVDYGLIKKTVALRGSLLRKCPRLLFVMAKCRQQYRKIIGRFSK